MTDSATFICSGTDVQCLSTALKKTALERYDPIREQVL